MPFARKTTKWAAVALVASAGIAATVLMWEPRADQPENARPTKSADPPGTFRPTQLQWRSLKLEPVVMRVFRPEQVTEGTIGVDDDLTTPVFSHYSGRVIKVLAMLGDLVEPGAALFVIHASEFVQAQNDLITALANLQSARSQLKMAQTSEKRTHDLYLAQGGSLKDWQQAQTDLITAQNTVRSDEIALHAVRNRLRILGKTDEEIASLEAQPTASIAAAALGSRRAPVHAGYQYPCRIGHLTIATKGAITSDGATVKWTECTEP